MWNNAAVDNKQLYEEKALNQKKNTKKIVLQVKLKKSLIQKKKVTKAEKKTRKRRKTYKIKNMKIKMVINKLVLV